MDAQINERIAYLYNEQTSLRRMEEILKDEFGDKRGLGRESIRTAIQKLKEKGRLDFIKNGESFLDELDEETGGIFKIGVLDCETTGLWADFGYTLCIVIKDITGDSKKGKYDVWRLDKFVKFKQMTTPEQWRRIDKELLEDFRKKYEEYDILIHFNGRNFDIKFLNTRLMKNQLHILPDMKQLDIYQIAKHRLRLRSKRLDSLKDFLEIDREEEGHRWEFWQMAANGQKAGYDYVVEHCKRDVDRLAEVAKRMKYQINFISK